MYDDVDKDVTWFMQPCTLFVCSAAFLGHVLALAELHLHLPTPPITFLHAGYECAVLIGPQLWAGMWHFTAMCTTSHHDIGPTALLTISAYQIGVDLPSVMYVMHLHYF